MRNLLQDLRFAFRQLRKSPVFAAAVIATLALGIGANTAIFSIVDAVLLRPLSYKNSDRLVVVWQTDPIHRGTGAWFDSYREFETWRNSSRSFERLAALSWATSGKAMMWHGKAVGLLALPASADFFSMLGAEAQIGRTFASVDAGNSCTLVLSYPFWQEKLGGPEGIAGQSVTVDRSSCVVVGVMPKDFSFYPAAANAWSLITPSSEFEQKPWESMTGVFGLLRPGVTRAQAEAELNAMEKRILPEAPASLGALTSSMPVVLDLHDNFTWLAGGNLRTALLALSGAVALILLMACLNVANLLLTRAMDRSQEMAVRAALGSSRARLVRQILTESLLLAFCGAGAGILLAAVLLRWFRSVNPVELPPGISVSLDFRVLSFAAALGVISAIVFGLFPAWRASHVDLNSALRSRERGLGAGLSAQRASRTLVVLQIALSLMLFVGAGLLSASLWRMSSAPLGYRTDHVLTATVNLPKEQYADADIRSRFAANLEQKVSALPGVAAMTLASSLTPKFDNPISVEGDASRFSASGVATQNVGPGFFDVMRIPLAQGRIFGTQDRKDGQQVAIVNEALANRYFPHANPIGHAIKLSRADDSSQPWLMIVGVAANVKTTSVFQQMGYVEQPAVYRPLAQDPPTSLQLMVVANGSPLELAGAIESQLASLDRGLVLSGVATINETLSAELSQPRFRAALFSGFAILALLLAAVGLYGVMAQMVAQRRRDLAIRMALGASRGQVLNRIFQETFILTAIGILLGLVGSAIAARAMASLLYEVRPENAGVLAVSSAVLLLTAFLASWNPARSAAKLDPMQTLRSE